LRQKFPLFLGIAAVAAVISLIAALGLLYFKLEKNGELIGVSRPAPEFSLPSLNGTQFGSEQMYGKPALLNFWTVWCTPCVAELPLLEETAQQYADELLVIGINQGDPFADVESFVAHQALNFPILLDYDENVGALFKVGGYPTSVFIDAEGTIRAIYLGEIPPAQLKKNLRLIGIK
jgi:thiol-disulfide isomerase/thioredoxin